MSDRRLREAARRWRESGDSEDEARLLREQRRVGQLTQERIEIAAYCGNVGAQLCGGGPQARVSGGDAFMDFATGITHRWDFSVGLRGSVIAASALIDTWEYETHYVDCHICRGIWADSLPDGMAPVEIVKRCPRGRCARLLLEGAEAFLRDYAELTRWCAREATAPHCPLWIPRGSERGIRRLTRARLVRADVYGNAIQVLVRPAIEEGLIRWCLGRTADEEQVTT